MKKLVTSYTFDASAQTVDSADFTSLEKIQLITNVTDGIVIYNFADSTKKGSLSGTTLTLTYNTTAMSDTDKLQIFVEDASVVQPVSGTVTANAGTNLNTSALALESGGNLATIAGKDFATQTTLAAIKAKTDNLDVALSTVAKDATLTDGTQLARLTDGTNTANVLKSDGTAAGQNAQLVGSSYLSVPFSVTSVSNLTGQDVAGYTWVSVHIVAQYTGSTPTITWQGSNDNTNWVGMSLVQPLSTLSSGSLSTTTSGVVFAGPLNFRYFRLSFTGTYSSGAATGTIYFSTLPRQLININGQVAINGTNAFNLSQVGGGTVAQGSGTATGALRVELPTNGTGVVGSSTPTGTTVPANAYYIAGQDNIGNLAGIKLAFANMNTPTGILAAGILGMFDDVSPTAIAENSFGTVRMSANRNLYVSIRDNAGNERGLNIDSNGALAAVLGAGTNAIGKLLPPNIDVTAHTNYARKYYTNAGAVTDGIVWSPAAGKRWHVVTMYIQTSADATITLEDDKVAGDDPVWKGEIAAKSGVTLSFTEQYPMASGEDAADLLITTSAGNVYVTVVGYEI